MEWPWSSTVFLLTSCYTCSFSSVSRHPAPVFLSFAPRCHESCHPTLLKCNHLIHIYTLQTKNSLSFHLCKTLPSHATKQRPSEWAGWHYSGRTSDARPGWSFSLYLALLLEYRGSYSQACGTERLRWQITTLQCQLELLATDLSPSHTLFFCSYTWHRVWLSKLNQNVGQCLAICINTTLQEHTAERNSHKDYTGLWHSLGDWDWRRHLPAQTWFQGEQDGDMAQSHCSFPSLHPQTPNFGASNESKNQRAGRHSMHLVVRICHKTHTSRSRHEDEAWYCPPPKGSIWLPRQKLVAWCCVFPGT